MFQQDYIMRLIHQMVRAILKLLFNIDTESPSVQLLEDAESKEVAEDLLEIIDSGNINQAENKLYELIENKTKENLLIGLVFYSYLNEKDEDYLIANDFSRDEIKDGVKHLVSEYGVEGVADLFFYD